RGTNLENRRNSTEVRLSRGANTNREDWAWRALDDLLRDLRFRLRQRGLRCGYRYCEVALRTAREGDVFRAGVSAAAPELTRGGMKRESDTKVGHSTNE